MKQKILCPILIPTIISLLAAVVISFIQREQPVRATSQSYSSIIHGWEQVNSDGFGDGNNMEAIRLAVYDNYLFASTENQATGGEVWRSANGTEWDQINVDGFGIVSNTIVFVEGSFNGYLYVGTKNKGTGAELWRCTTCDGSIWTRVVSNGFNDPNNETVANHTRPDAAVTGCTAP